MTNATDYSRGYHLFRDGDQWCAVGPAFINVQESPHGFGKTTKEAVVELRNALSSKTTVALPSMHDFTVHGAKAPNT